MLSKEETEKAKETCNSIVNFCNNNKECQENEFCPDCYIEIEDVKAIETLLQYIKELEITNAELDKENNRLEKIEFERDKANKMINEMVEEYEYNARCNLNNFCDEEMRKDKCIQDCRICIKQYFEKKVEGK